MSDSPELIAADYWPLCYGALSRPSKTQASQYCLVGYPSFADPLLECLRFPERGYKPVVRSVVLLLSLRRPPAIAGLVVTPWVQTIQRVLGRWRLAHVCEEVFKAPPSLAHGNALGSIFSVAASAWILAASTHVDPAVIEPRVGHAVCRAFFAGPYVHLSVETATRARATTSESLTAYFSDLPAVALASPFDCTSVGAPALVNNRPSTEASSSQIEF